MEHKASSSKNYDFEKFGGEIPHFSLSKKMDKKFKQDKGVAGLTILLSMVVMLFVVGLLVYIFVLMGTELSDSTYTETTGTKQNDTLASVDEKSENFSLSTYRNIVCTILKVVNASDGAVVPAVNYTQTNCNIKYSASTMASGFNGSNWNVTYSYVYDADNDATNIMNDTKQSMNTVTTWFDIFIVIGAMVVLILLTVIIISSIKGSGMVAGAGTQRGANSVGTA